MGVLLWIALIVFILVNKDNITAEAIVNYSPENPVLSAFALAGVSVLKSLTFVFYSGIIYAANGMLFPLPIAIILNIIDGAIIATVPYLVYGRYVSKIIDKLHDKYPKLERIQRARKKSDYVFAFLLRNIKVINFDLGSSYMGGIKVKFPQFVAASVTAMLPEMVTFPIMISHVDDPISSGFIIPLVFNVVCTVTAMLIISRLMKKG